MKIIGNKSDVAIEYKFDDTITEYHYGNYCLWLNNNVIGNIKVDAVFSILIGDLKTALYTDRYFSKELFFTKDRKIIYKSLQYHRKLNSNRNFDKFACFVGETFDDFYIRCICFQDQYRFIWKNFKNDRKIYSEVVRGESLRTVFKEFIVSLPPRSRDGVPIIY